MVPPTTVTDSGILSTAADNVGSSDQYPVIMALSGVQIDQTGIGYNPGDTVTVSGFDGNGQEISLTGNLSVGRNGELFGVEFDDNDIEQNIGFVEPPLVRVNTKTGAGAGLIPYLKVKYRGEFEITQAFQEGFSQAAVISVIDCVGATPVGYVNGRPSVSYTHLTLPTTPYV